MVVKRMIAKRRRPHRVHWFDNTVVSMPPPNTNGPSYYYYYLDDDDGWYGEWVYSKSPIVDHPRCRCRTVTSPSPHSSGSEEAEEDVAIQTDWVPPRHKHDDRMNDDRMSLV